MNKRRAEARWMEKRKLWQITVKHNGVRRDFYSSQKGRAGKHEAEAKADAWLESGTADRRFPEAWEAFMDDLKARTGTANYSQREAIGRLHLIPVIKNRRLNDITPVIWQSCINAAAAEGLSRRSCTNIKGAISAFIHFCQRSRWNIQPLIDGDITIPNSAAPEKEKTILQPDDIRTLFSQDKIKKSGHMVKAHYIHAWRFIVATGLRRGELVGLKNEDITSTTVTIRRSINSYGEETFGKNNNARRTIVLTSIAKQILSDQKAYLKEIGVISPWVFPDEDGNRANPISVYDRWRFFCGQHGFKTTIHELRHTFVSLNKQMPVEMMKAVVGHSTDMDTYGVYGHDVAGDSKRAAEIIDQTFGNILK